MTGPAGQEDPSDAQLIEAAELNAIFTNDQDQDQKLGGGDPTNQIESNMAAAAEVDRSESDEDQRTAQLINDLTATELNNRDQDQDDQNEEVTEVKRLVLQTDDDDNQPEAEKSGVQKRTAAGEHLDQLREFLNEYQDQDNDGGGGVQEEQLEPEKWPLNAYEYAEQVEQPADQAVGSDIPLEGGPNLELDQNGGPDDSYRRANRRKRFTPALQRSPIETLTTELKRAESEMIDHAVDLSLGSGPSQGPGSTTPLVLDLNSLPVEQLLTDEVQYVDHKVRNRLDAADGLREIQDGISRLAGVMDRIDSEPIEAAALAVEEEQVAAEERQRLETQQCVLQIEDLTSGCADLPSGLIKSDNLTQDLNDLLLDRIFTTSCDWHEVCYQCVSFRNLRVPYRNLPTFMPNRVKPMT